VHELDGYTRVPSKENSYIKASKYWKDITDVQDRHDLILKDITKLQNRLEEAEKTLREIIETEGEIIYGANILRAAAREYFEKTNTK